METPQKKRYTPPAEIKVEKSTTEQPTENPSVCYVRLDLLKDGTYAVSNDAPLTLAHAAMLNELARDIAIHFHEAAQKRQAARGGIGLPRVDPRLRVN